VIRLSGLIARRSLLRNLIVVAIMTAVAAIAFIFAWMSPSIVEARLAVWRQLPPGLPISVGPGDGGPACTGIYTFVSVQGPEQVATPIGAHGGSLPGSLGLDPRRTDSVVVLDALAAVAAGVRDGDEVTVIMKSAHVSGPAEVRSIPIWLSDDSSGGVAALVGDSDTVRAALARYGPADTSICVGEGSMTAGQLLAEHQRATASDGLGTVATVFAGLAGVAWLAVALLVLGATLRRRQAFTDLCVVYGTEPRLARLAGVSDVVADAIAAAVLATALALVLRQDVLRTWTDPGLIGLSLVGVLCLLAGATVLAAFGSRRSGV